MKTAKVLHDKAMECVDEAKMASMKGDKSTSLAYLQSALALEMQAVERLSDENMDDLTRHLYLRSAAFLAFDTSDFNLAAQLAATALANDPPGFILEQLWELQEKLAPLLPSRSLAKQAKSVANGHRQINGKLTVAREPEQEIEVEETGSRRRYVLLVPPGKLKEIVQRYFSEVVQVKATSDPQGVFLLESISKAA